jgi:hypothetical protein
LLLLLLFPRAEIFFILAFNFLPVFKSNLSLIGAYCVEV